MQVMILNVKITVIDKRVEGLASVINFQKDILLGTWLARRIAEVCGK